MNFPEKSLLSRNSTVSAVSGSAVGSLINWLGTLDNIPEGCILADGSMLNVSDYQELYDIIKYRATNIDLTPVSDVKSGTVWASIPVGTPVAYDFYNSATNGGTYGKYILPYYGTINKYIPFHANTNVGNLLTSWGSISCVGNPYNTNTNDYRWAYGRPLTAKVTANVFLTDNVNSFPKGVKYIRNVANLGAFPEGNYKFSFQTGYWSSGNGFPPGSVSVIVIREDDTEEVVKTFTDGTYNDTTDVNYDNSVAFLRNSTLQTITFNAFITGAFKGVYFRINRRHQSEPTYYYVSLCGCTCTNLDEKLPVVRGILTNIVSASSTAYSITLGYNYGVYTKPAHGYTIGSDMYIIDHGVGYTYTPPDAAICSDVDHSSIARVLDGNQLLIDIGKTSNEYTKFRIPDLITDKRFIRYSSVSMLLEATAAPNITGTFNAVESYGQVGTGAFYLAGGGAVGTGDSDGDNGRFGFSASRSSSVYQTGVTEVRPVNMSAIPIIKYTP